jgi:hypothetical protein
MELEIYARPHGATTKNIELKYYGNILGDDEAIKRPNSYDRMESHVIARHADF